MLVFFESRAAAGDRGDSICRSGRRTLQAGTSTRERNTVRLSGLRRPSALRTPRRRECADALLSLLPRKKSQCEAAVRRHDFSCPLPPGTPDKGRTTIAPWPRTSKTSDDAARAVVWAGTTVLLEARQDGQEVMMSPARYCFNRFELGEASKTSRTSAKRSLHRGFGNTGRASAGYHCHLSPKLHCRVASLPAFHRRQPPCRTERVVSSNYDRRRSRLWVFALGIWLSDFGLGVSGSSINLSRPFTAIARFFFRKTRPCPPFSAEPAS